MQIVFPIHNIVEKTFVEATIRGADLVFVCLVLKLLVIFAMSRTYYVRIEEKVGAKMGVL